ncbi:hypothetical protein GCM10023092_22490 [Rurimicrobium arvi]|uniref:PH domain-containing protein n=1 Tax=Rurimicrobium arvi TaxID=2049916 RepID=A0ABP8MZ79_9BACT
MLVVGSLIAYAAISYKSEDLWVFRVYSGILIPPQLLVVALLHLKYTSANKGMELTLDTARGVARVRRNGQEFCVGKGDVQKCVWYVSPKRYYKGTLRVALWDEYQHLVVELRDGSRVVISSLLADPEEVSSLLNAETTTRIWFPVLFRRFV